VSLEKPVVVTPHVPDLHDLAGARGALLSQRVVLRERGRAGFLEKEMLACPQDLEGERAVVDGPGREHHGVDVVAREELGIAEMRHSKPFSDLLGPAGAGSGNRHELGPVEPLGVLGMNGSHPAEAGDAEPKRRRRP
jgi:hypothetical protein